MRNANSSIHAGQFVFPGMQVHLKSELNLFYGGARWTVVPGNGANQTCLLFRGKPHSTKVYQDGLIPGNHWTCIQLFTMPLFLPLNFNLGNFVLSLGQESSSAMLG